MRWGLFRGSLAKNLLNEKFKQEQSSEDEGTITVSGDLIKNYLINPDDAAELKALITKEISSIIQDAETSIFLQVVRQWQFLNSQMEFVIFANPL